MTLTEAIQVLKQDPDFCRGVRRGVGLVLASFVISQSLGCALYPLLGIRGIFFSAAITSIPIIIIIVRR